MDLDREDHTHRRNTANTEIMDKLEYKKSAQEIAIEIVDQLPTIFSDDLRRLIAEAIDVERKRMRSIPDLKLDVDDQWRVKKWLNQQRLKHSIE